MGATNSALVSKYELPKLKQQIIDNNIKSFKEGIKRIKPNAKDLKELIMETICRERKDFFDLLLGKFELLINHSEPSNHIITSYYEECFSASLKRTTSYFAQRLIEVNRNVEIKKRTRTLLHMAVHFEHVFVSHQLILYGADINAYDLIGATPLDVAIKCNNLELICMLLYYGAYANDLPDNLTSFMYSIVCKSDEEIQRTLMEYEIDFNLSCSNMSTLFFAIKYNSPLILDIIDRGSDVNYYNGIDNVISLAMLYNCDPKIFQVLWDKFDYTIWRSSYSKCVLLKLLESDISINIWVKYLNIIMENEKKLQVDLQHHNNSYFFTSDFLISTFYLQCFEKGLGRDIIQSLILHLLSHGAHIFKQDIDKIYNNIPSPCLDEFLYMDLIDNDNFYSSIMYLKYTPEPNLSFFILNVLFLPIQLDKKSEHLQRLRMFYNISSILQNIILETLDVEDSIYEVCKKIFEKSESFPSLLQLSRDSARKALCHKYTIKNSCQLYTYIKHLRLPKFIEDILLFNKCIY